MCFAPSRVVTTGTAMPCPHGRRPTRCKECGLMNPRAWRTSSATLVTCVKYASVCVSPGGRRPGGGTHTAAGLPGVGPGSGLTH
eukprot:scaffold14813_cov57-Phaeocystis_antarctica.AAC.1